jgi:hypothetical protein
VYKWPINIFTYPNPVYSHSKPPQYIRIFIKINEVYFKIVHPFNGRGKKEKYIPVTGPGGPYA